MGDAHRRAHGRSVVDHVAADGDDGGISRIMIRNVRASEAPSRLRTHGELFLKNNPRWVSVSLCASVARTLIMIAACEGLLHAHSGPPFPIVTDQQAGAYRVTVWTDPDATDDQ